MKRITTSQTGTGTGAWIPLNYNNSVVDIALQCVVTGTVDYTIQHTLDDIFNADVTPTAFSHAQTNLVTATTTQEGYYEHPVAATRLKVNSGTGSVAYTIIEQGI